MDHKLTLKPAASIVSDKMIKLNGSSQWCCEEIFHTPTLTIGKKFYLFFTPLLCNTVGLRKSRSIYQHKQDVFGWIWYGYGIGTPAFS